jgi:lysophospholipase L1-like esterase
MSQFLNRVEREMKRRRRTPAQLWSRRVLLALLLACTPALALEIVLRAAGFWRPQVDPDMQAKTIRACVEALNARFAADAFVEDPHLLWKLKPGSNLGGIDVTNDGLLGELEQNPLDVSRSHSAQRVLCLGDSVTAITYRTYATTAQRLANSVALARPLEIRNAAVPGYTTEQALRWFEKLQAWRPDVVLLCFGWNDQFSALNVPDRELGYSNPVTAALHRLLGRVRIYQLIAAPVEAKLLGHSTNSDARARNAKKSGSTSGMPFESNGMQRRVSPEQFEENLRTLVQRVRSLGAMPVLITEPENLAEASEKNLESRNFVSGDLGKAGEVHHAYNHVVRRVAIETHVPLMDLDEEFLRRQREHLFEADGIHLTGRGHNHVARLLLALLRDEGRITSAEYDQIAAAERHDTTAPDKPRAAWSVVPPQAEAATTQTVDVAVVARNVGNTRWLRSHIISKFGNRTNVSYGGVSIVGTWRTIDSPNAGTAAQAHLPSDILPGETTSVTLSMAAPKKPGNYELEIGLRADQIGDLKQFGAETTTFTLIAHQ